MKDILNRLGDNRKRKIGEVIRFGIVGCIASLIQYGVYLLMLQIANVSISNTVGYIVSFCFNFIASTYFTFHVKASMKHGAGFAFSHVINYLLQLATLNFFVWAGISRELAPIPMFCVCVPVNFLLVRFFLKK